MIFLAKLITLLQVSPLCVCVCVWGGHGRAPLTILRFFEPPPPSKPMPPMGHTPHLKMKLPLSEKQTLPLKREAPFHKMIPRKSTINNNLKSS